MPRRIGEYEQALYSSIYQGDAADTLEEEEVNGLLKIAETADMYFNSVDVTTATADQDRIANIINGFRLAIIVYLKERGLEALSISLSERWSGKEN